MLDTEGEPLRLGLEAEPFLVSPNQREAEALVGQEFYEQQDFALALEHIAELGARNVLITNESGCFARLREGRKTRRYRARAPQVEPVSERRQPATSCSRRSSPRTSTGRPPEEALRDAVAAGAASTLELGAGRFEPREMATRSDADVGRLRSRGRRRPTVKLFSLEGLELGRIEVERLLALEEKFAREGLAFDDVLLVPAESEVLPNDVSTRTRLTREIELAIPVVSAAMDTVTEARLAIALARVGGIGIVHRNLSIEDQVAEVDKVKRSEAGMIVEPVTLPPDALVAEALELMARYRISGVPITDADGVLVGILTNRDLRFETRHGAARERADDRAATSSPRRSGRRSTRPSGSSTATRSRSSRSSTPTAASRGLITVKDISKRHRVPGRDEGRAGAPARRARRSASAPTRSSAPRRSPPPASTCSSSTRPTATRSGVLEMARRSALAPRRPARRRATSRPPRRPRR